MADERYATFVFMIFMQRRWLLQLLEMAWQEKRDRSDYEENEPQGTDLYDRWRDCAVCDHGGNSVRGKRCTQRKRIV